jgi:hypothetical protein
MNYRVLEAGEESKYERWLGNGAETLFCRRLKEPDMPPLHFIVPDAFGEHQSEDPVLGFYHRRQIFIRSGLQERDLILTVAHECRHAFQARTGKYCLNKDFRESDAKIYELEVNLPSGDARELRLWLLRELAFEQEPGLRDAYKVAEQVMARRTPAAVSTPAIRSVERMPEQRMRIANSRQERIAQIRALLARLPETPQYGWQRANLSQELAELVRGVAA